MAKTVPASEVGLGDIGRVRVSTSRARRGKILAVEHPIFGWVPYRQWALLRLVPEERILPAVIVGLSTYWVLRLAEDAIGKISFRVPGTTFPAIVALTGPLGALLGLLSPLIFPDVKDPMKLMEPGLIEKAPFSFYGALLTSGLTLAGLDPGTAIRGFAEILDAITPLT